MQTTSSIPAAVDFHDRIGCERGWDENDGGIGAGFSARFLDGVEHIDAFMLRAAFSGRHSADNLGSIFYRLKGVEGAFATGNALNNQPRVLIY